MWWDRFDIIEAYYIYYRDNHSGQDSIGYKRLYHITEYFKPACNLSYDTMSENSQYIYDNLVLDKKPA